MFDLSPKSDPKRTLSRHRRRLPVRIRLIPAHVTAGGARMLFEDFRTADVAADRLDRTVA
jgi:hypothetical protein